MLLRLQNLLSEQSTRASGFFGEWKPRGVGSYFETNRTHGSYDSALFYALFSLPLLSGRLVPKLQRPIPVPLDAVRPHAKRSAPNQASLVTLGSIQRLIRGYADISIILDIEVYRYRYRYKDLGLDTVIDTGEGADKEKDKTNKYV